MYVLVMCGDFSADGTLGPRTLARLAVADTFAHDYEDVTLVFATGKSDYHSPFECALSEIMLRNVSSNVKAVHVEGAPTFDSEGELTSFLNAFGEEPYLAVVSGNYHLRRIRFLIGRMRGKDFANNRIAYVNVAEDVLTANITVHEILAWAKLHTPRRLHRVGKRLFGFWR